MRLSGVRQVGKFLFPDDFLAGVPEPGQLRVVDGDEGAVLVQRVVAAGGVIVQVADLFDGFLQRLFRLLARRQLGSELTVDFLNLLRAPKNLGLHFVCTRSQLSGDSVLFMFRLLEANELCDIFDAVNDVGEFPVRAENRGIDRTPIPFLESASFRFGPADVVFLHRHGIRRSILQHSGQRRAQIRDSGRGWVIGIFRKDVEQVSPQNLLPLRHRRAQIRVAHGHDRQGRRQNEVQPGYRFKQGPEIRLLERR